MKSQSDIEINYEYVKKLYEEAENDMDVPEGDFNVLKAEYEMLVWVLDK